MEFLKIAHVNQQANKRIITSCQDASKTNLVIITRIQRDYNATVVTDACCCCSLRAFIISHPHNVDIEI